jgi:hypothetical protein
LAALVEPVAEEQPHRAQTVLDARRERHARGLVEVPGRDRDLDDAGFARDDLSENLAVTLLFRPLRAWRSSTAVAAVVLLVAVGWGVFVNARGSLSRAAQMWNSTPVWIYPDSSRLWSWSDPPFFRTGHYTFANLDKAPLPALTSQQLCIYS